ncbi:Uu.00g046770.m01.CDS01 [Anthostomella pinea]|uniref:Uu.00g046770.m01.CDS01 n=1 Tax=Anthostomella pinea TaxID=933095 RepID=A0AAI8YC47_9PEZI|nr:Uu.00g046770.m01.CDS01 [Anthostomella pinea]
MEALQMAQMLADLNDLQAAQDQSASKALVGANKTLDQKNQLQVPQPQERNHRRSATESRVISSTSGRSLSDKFGYRIFTPPLTRNNSSTPSCPGTPRGEHGPDTDVDRASTLLSLYEIRAKLKEQDSSSLMKAREKINALAAKQAHMAELKSGPTSAPSHNDRGSSDKGRISYPRSH